MLVGAGSEPSIDSAVVDVEVVSKPLTEVDADLAALGLHDGEELPAELREAPGAGDVKTGFQKTTTLLPARPRHVVVVGLGKPEDTDLERLRVAAALAAKLASAHSATSIAWSLPGSDGGGPDAASAATAVVEGTMLAAHRFDRFRTRDADDPPPPALERLVLVAGEDADTAAIEREARVATVVTAAANRTRDLQELPSNLKNPAYLAARADEIASAHDAVSAESLGPAEIEELGMGGIVAVSAGSAQEPRLIVLRYSGASDDAETLGLVGKGVTFDSGGISIKPAARMHEMKMDMSGGAAVLEAVAAIAELELPLNVVGVVPAVENMPSGTATRPGDIITQLNGKTVEVNDTDAEGRLILADALTYCVRDLVADRVVDLATLTGSVVVALGSTYAGLISNDDDWAQRVETAADATGELAWRLPLHPEYKELTKGTIADFANVSAKRKAGTIYAGSFLEEFVDSKPWVHLDIAGTAWDTGREYVGKGPSGYGVRLLVALARNLADA
jgi:leucyl aminopeptidase